MNMILEALFGSAVILSCPDLSGTYYCKFPSPPGFSEMVVQQHVREDAAAVVYTTAFTDLSTDPEVVEANEAGIVDSSGWLNRCEGGRLVSVDLKRGEKSEIWLESDHSYLQSFDGVVMIRCSFVPQ